MSEYTWTPKPRCEWAGKDPLYCEYHDHEWGIPQHDDRRLFELLVLEGFQAGLSWITILRKRHAFTRAFDNWDVRKIAAYTPQKIERLLQDPAIVRNRKKIEAAVANARSFMSIQREFGSFDQYIWQFTGFATLAPAHPWKDCKAIPCRTPESTAMSKDLQKRGFRFVGPTICYAYMQAIGMVNDHTTDCFCYNRD